MELDKKDKTILQFLREDSSLTTSQISKKTAIPITTVHNRIKKLNSLGIIKNYTVKVDFEKLGKTIKAYILIGVSQNNKVSQEEICEKIKKLDDVETTDIVTGTTDIIAIVRSESISSLNETVTQKLRNIPGVSRTQTVIVLKEV